MGLRARKMGSGFDVVYNVLYIKFTKSVPCMFVKQDVMFHETERKYLRIRTRTFSITHFENVQSL